MAPNCRTILLLFRRAVTGVLQASPGLFISTALAVSPVSFGLPAGLRRHAYVTVRKLARRLRVEDCIRCR